MPRIHTIDWQTGQDGISRLIPATGQSTTVVPQTLQVKSSPSTVEPFPTAPAAFPIESIVTRP
jgi:hypothetical protein